MANTQSMCTSFMQELMLGQHQFGSASLTSRGSLTAPTTDTFKAALYFASATVNASTTAYSSTGEVTNTSGSGYTAGGVTITNGNAPASSNTSSTAGFIAAVANYVAEIWRQADDGIWEARSPPQHYTHSKVMAWLALCRAAGADTFVAGTAFFKAPDRKAFAAALTA